MGRGVQVEPFVNFDWWIWKYAQDARELQSVENQHQPGQFVNWSHSQLTSIKVDIYQLAWKAFLHLKCQQLFIKNLFFYYFVHRKELIHITSFFILTFYNSNLNYNQFY